MTDIIKNVKVRLVEDGDFEKPYDIAVDAERVILKNGKDLETSNVYIGRDLESFEITGLDLNYLTVGDVIDSPYSGDKQKPVSANQLRLVNDDLQSEKRRRENDFYELLNEIQDLRREIGNYKNGNEVKY